MISSFRDKLIYSLASAYIANSHPLMALQTFRKALDLAPEHQFADDARKTVKELEKLADKLLSEIGLDDEEGWEIAIFHEQGQAFLEEGNYEAARQAENEVLQRRPDFLSAHNNLSLISWLEGKTKDAIATAQTVLDEDPNNIHALSNLVHFLAIQGDEAAARPYAERLKVIQGEASDGWTKKVEGLSYLRDDAAVVEVFEQARANWEIEHTARFPDYLFARTAKAKNLTLEGDLEAAEALLTPILERERFHVLEFSPFADAYITWLVAKKQWDGEAMGRGPFLVCYVGKGEPR